VQAKDGHRVYVHPATTARQAAENGDNQGNPAPGT
jgi:hypothetical protein